MTWETDLNQSIADSEAAIAQAPTPNCGGGDIVNDAYNLKVAELNSKITDLRAAYDSGIPPMCVPAPLSLPNLFSRYNYVLESVFTVPGGYGVQDLSGMCLNPSGNVFCINENGIIHEMTPQGVVIRTLTLVNYPFAVGRDIEAISIADGQNQYWIVDESSQNGDGYASSAIKVTITDNMPNNEIDCSGVVVPIGARKTESAWYDPASQRSYFLNEKPIDFPMFAILPDNTTVQNDPFEPRLGYDNDRIHSAKDADLNPNLTPNPLIITGALIEEVDRVTGDNVGRWDGGSIMYGKLEGLAALDNADIFVCKEANNGQVYKLKAVPI